MIGGTGVQFALVGAAVAAAALAAAAVEVLVMGGLLMPCYLQVAYGRKLSCNQMYTLPHL